MRKFNKPIKIADISELKEGMTVYVEYVKNKGKMIKIENRPNKDDQRAYRSFWSHSIKMGVVYREI